MAWWRFALLDLAVLAIVALAVGYLRRYRLPRPPVGRFNRSDVVIMSCLLVALPFGYLALSPVAVSTVFGVMFLGIAHLTLAPVLGPRLAALAAVALVAAAVAAAVLDRPALVLAANAVLIAVALVGVTNLWAQTGMSTGHVAALAAVLVAYDLLATGLTDVTTRFVALVNGYAFAPLLAVTAGETPVAAGLGDCLMLTVWAVVTTRAYGRAQGRLAAAAGLALLVAAQTAIVTGLVKTGVPFLVVLGPAIVLHWLLLRRLRGPGRRTREWLGVPETEVDTTGRDGLATAMRTARESDTVLPGTWLAVHDGTVVGEGPTPGSARRAARLGGFPHSPTVVQVADRDQPAARP